MTLLARILLAVAFAAQVYNALHLPTFRDYDAPGHALNAYALHRGEMPDPSSWSGFHPPLAYAIGALAWRLGDGWLRTDAALRLVSVVAGLLAVLLVHRVLRGRVGERDAALVTAAAYCTPVVVITTSMLGNEALCMLLVTAVLARLVAVPDLAAGRLVRHAIGTAAFAALAVLTKVTAALVVPVAGLAYAWRVREAPARAARAALVAIALPVLAGGAFFAHLMAATGSGPSVVLSGSVASPEARAEMAPQPPGVRHLRDYVSFPLAAVVRPHITSAGLASSVPGLFYATLQADAMGHYLPAGTRPRALAAGALLALAGLLPTGLGLLGLLHVLRRPREHAWLLLPTAYAALMAAAFLHYQWSIPHYSAGKASYASSALLPAAGWLAVGLGGLSDRVAAVARVLLLAVAALAVVVLWQGHWQ